MVVCLCNNKMFSIDIYWTISVISKSVACILGENKQYFIDHFILRMPLDIEKQNLPAELNKFGFLTDHCEVI